MILSNITVSWANKQEHMRVQAFVSSQIPVLFFKRHRFSSRIAPHRLQCRWNLAPVRVVTYYCRVHVSCARWEPRVQGVSWGMAPCHHAPCQGPPALSPRLSRRVRPEAAFGKFRDSR